MSADGIRAAEHIGEDMPLAAVTLAADLRNAVTLALSVADDMRSVEDATDIRDSVATVLRIADALGGKRG